MIFKKKIYLLFSIVVISSFIIYEFGFFLPKRYCIGPVCIKRPAMYKLHLYQGSNTTQLGLCAYTFSCTNQFSLSNKTFSTLIFSNIIGDDFSLGVSNYGHNDDYKFLYKIESYYKCSLIKGLPSYNDNEYSVNAFFKDSNISFLLLADDEVLVKDALDDLCKN